MLNWLLALINKRQKQLYEENRELAAANRRVQADNLQLRHDLAELGVNASRLCTHISRCHDIIERIGHYHLTSPARRAYNAAVQGLKDTRSAYDEMLEEFSKREDKD
ncbi:hypothetical protein UJ30_04525 [Salmonella enterica subsp. enterica serovar Agona]|nr:hypothetical protein [Salmonella enterica subsp. enterica serovar Agona]